MSPTPFLLRFPTDVIPPSIAAALEGIGNLTPMQPREYLLVASYERDLAIIMNLQERGKADGTVEITRFP